MTNKKYPEIIVGLDIGSTAIRIAVGQYTAQQNNIPDLQVVGLVEVPSEGMHKGIVSSIEDVVSSISNALEQTERLIGIPIESVWVGISGANIICQENRGIIAVAKSNGEISEEDVERAVESSKTLIMPLNHEIIHVLPKSYNVDGQTGIKDPVGMTGMRLESNVQIIYALTSHIKNITKAIYRTGIDIEDLVLSILATGEAVTTSRQRELGTAVVNIGGSTTSLVVYEDGDIIHTTILPIGSEHVTNDLAIGLKTSIDLAEKVKIEYGNCLAKNFTKKEKIELNTLDPNCQEVVSQQYVAEIIEARLSEILEKIDNELSKIGKSGKLPAGVIFTGGGSKINGIVELAKQQLALSATIGYPLFVSSSQRKLNDISFVASIGLVKWGAAINQEGKKRIRKMKRVNNVFKKVKDMWKSFLP